MEVILEFLHSTPYTNAYYACFLPNKTSSYQKILNYSNAVRLLHRFNSFSVDALDSFDVNLTKRGLRCLLGTTSRHKHPITPEILLTMRRYLDTSLPSHAAIWALFCTAFFSFLRKSNLSVATAKSFDPTRHLTRQGIKLLLAEHLQREGLLLIPLPRNPSSILCRMSAIVPSLALVSCSSISTIVLPPHSF